MTFMSKQHKITTLFSMAEIISGLKMFLFIRPCYLSDAEGLEKDDTPIDGLKHSGKVHAGYADITFYAETLKQPPWAWGRFVLMRARNRHPGAKRCRSCTGRR